MVEYTAAIEHGPDDRPRSWTRNRQRPEWRRLRALRPHVGAEVKQRDPKKGELSLTAEFATIPRLQRGCSAAKGSGVARAFALTARSGLERVRF